MNIELFIQVTECVELCKKLDSLLEEDRDVLSGHLQGSLLDAYNQNTQLAREQITVIKNELLLLQSALSSGL